MTERIGSLVAKLGADISDFRASFEQASQIAQDHQKTINDTLGAADAAFKAVVAGGAALYINSLIEIAAQTDVLSQRTGHSVEFLSELRVAFAQGGIDTDAGATALGKFNQNLTLASDSSSKQAEIFRLLGVDITQGPTQALIQFAAKASAIDDATVKTSVFREMLGKTGDALIPVFQNLDTATASAQKMGAVMSEQAAKAAEQFNNDLKTLQVTSQTLTINALEPVLTGLASLTDNLVKGAEAGEKWDTAIKEVLKTAAALAGGLSSLGPSLIPTPDGMGDPMEELFTQLSGSNQPSVQWGDPNNPFGSKKAAGPSPDSKAIQDQITGAAKAAAAERQRIEEETNAAILKSDTDLLNAQEKNLEELGEAQRKQALDYQAQARQAQQDDITAYGKYLDDKVAMENAVEGAAAQAQLKKIHDQAKQTNDMAKSLGYTMASSFEQAVTAGGHLSDVLKGLADDILKVILRTTVTNPLGGAIASGIGSLFGGAHADGGGMPPNTWNLVGEQGPELVWSGANGGNVIPNNQLGGGGPTIYADMRGASMDAVQRLQAWVAQIDGNLEQRAAGAALNFRRRNPGAWAAA
jgi:hypothetical protein